VAVMGESGLPSSSSRSFIKTLSRTTMLGISVGAMVGDPEGDADGWEDATTVG
jgi:hypothetical protein